MEIVGDMVNNNNQNLSVKNEAVAEVLTEELLQELLDYPSIDQIEKNEQQYTENVSLSELLNQYANETKMTCKDIIHKTNINPTHCYQIFSGDRGASRNKVLQLALALHLDYKACNRLLHAAGVSALYCKNRRDAIYIFCLNADYSVEQTNVELFKFSEDTLSY